VGTIATQSSDKLPLSVAGPLVYSPIGMVLPVSATPLICNPVGSYINVISGGTCKLNYSTPATADYLPSDVIPLTFEITRKAQSVTFSTPSTLALSSGSFVLSGSASTGLPVTYQTQTPSVCEVSGTKLNLKKAGNCQITALQVGSSTISPASVTQSIAITGVAAVKKIACIKNGKVKYFLSKKCPAGYKQKK
jgi:hypothetical protein